MFHSRNKPVDFRRIIHIVPQPTLKDMKDTRDSMGMKLPRTEKRYFDWMVPLLGGYRLTEGTVNHKHT
jgi:hypothetical protein